MKTYDIKCPVCGTVNHSLFLHETDGWMECEKCGTESRVLTLRTLKVIPHYTSEQLASIGKRIVAAL